MKATNRGYISRAEQGVAICQRGDTRQILRPGLFLSLYEGMCPRQSYAADTASDQLSRWRKKLIEQTPKLFSDGRKDPLLERIAQLEQLVGRLTLELEILKKPRAC